MSVWRVLPEIVRIYATSAYPDVVTYLTRVFLRCRSIVLSWPHWKWLAAPFLPMLDSRP